MVDVAREVGADAVSHGCTGKGNDQASLTMRLTEILHVIFFFFPSDTIVYYLGSV